MTVKIFKAVWFLSLMAVLGVLLYVYASLPEEIRVTEGEMPFHISRNGFFYLALTFLSLLNVMIFIFSRSYRGANQSFAVWLYGQVTFLHLFIVVALQFISLYHSMEKYDYSRLGPIIYGSLGLVVVWFILGTSYLLMARIFGKPAV